MDQDADGADHRGPVPPGLIALRRDDVPSGGSAGAAEAFRSW
ncbi:hypothetical protein ACIF6K_10360 [Streptomyces sp. NPDC085942]|nr:hypothetical protein OG543_23930 [Streptomyces sp. NBC_01178]